MSLHDLRGGANNSSRRNNSENLFCDPSQSYSGDQYYQNYPHQGYSNSLGINGSLEDSFNNLHIDRYGDSEEFSVDNLNPSISPEMVNIKQVLKIYKVFANLSNKSFEFYIELYSTCCKLLQILILFDFLHINI